MALIREIRQSDDRQIIPAVNSDERIAYGLEATDSGRSNFAAFLLGGVVIAGGLLAFLYYDTDNLNRDDFLTTGSITQSAPREMQSPPALRIPVQPQTADK